MKNALPFHTHLGLMVERFSRHERIHQPEEQYRARILVGCLVVMSLNAFLISAYQLHQYLHGKLAVEGTILSCFTGLFYFLCLWAMKRTGKTLLIAHAFALPLYLSLTIAYFLAGGPTATSSQIMLLIPFTVFFTAGIRSGYAWALIVLATHLSIFIMHKQGFDFVQSMDQETIIEQSLLHWLIALSGIVGIARVYEKAHENLVSQRDKRESDNRYLSEHDLLTGVHNRQSLEKQLSQYLKATHKLKMTLTVITLDIEQFHLTNLRYGYKVGDNILQTLAVRMQNLPDIKLVGRTNGNRFTLVSHAHASDVDREKLVRDVLFTATQPFSIGHQIISISVSLGWASLTNGMMTSDEILLEAEKSLLKAREGGIAYLPFLQV